VPRFRVPPSGAATAEDLLGKRQSSGGGCVECRQVFPTIRSEKLWWDVGILAQPRTAAAMIMGSGNSNQHVRALMAENARKNGDAVRRRRRIG
jgi:hypothetical protein